MQGSTGGLLERALATRRAGPYQVQARALDWPAAPPSGGSSSAVWRGVTPHHVS